LPSQQTSPDAKKKQNATVSANGKQATLTLNGETMQVELVTGANLSFGTAEPVRLPNDPPLPAGSPDLPNPGVTVLTIDIPAGSTSYQVLFTPQWPNVQSSSYVNNPPEIPMAQWTLTNAP
jgi:hypothetical protein